MNNAIQNLVVSVFGFVSSTLAALVLWKIEEYSGISIYSFSVWFFIPAGAIACGFVSAGGYYAGSLLFGHRPTKILLLNMVFISISTFFTIYWLAYSSLVVNGKAVSDYISFARYMEFTLEHQSMEFRVHGAKVGDTGEMGNLGYVVALLQVIGFAIGGFVTFAYLTSQPYCVKCSKYLKKKSKTLRFSSSSQYFTEMVNSVSASFNAGQFQKAMLDHSNFGEKKGYKGAYLNSTLLRKQCSKCGIHWLGFSAQKLNKNHWEEIKQLKFSKFYSEDIHS